MSEPKRRFFSGDTLQQALVQAANLFNLAPEEIAYRSIEKRHGFLKVRRKVVIEVNPDAPKREAGAAPPPSAEAPSFSAPPPLSPLPPDAARPPGDWAEGARPAAPERPPQRDDREGRPPRQMRSRDRGPRAGQDNRGQDNRGQGNRGPDNRGRDDRGRDDRGNRALPPERRGGDGRRGEDPRRRHPGAPRYPRDAERRPVVVRGDEQPPAAALVGMAAAGLVALPETPRRPSERFPAAAGPMAEAAAKGVELLLRIAGLELTPRILQGEDRLEVDLSGPDVDWCFADDGEFVLAVEHLLPRLIRSLCGEMTLVRVDCDNFQEIREERLRSLAQQVAEEVRRRGKPRTLEPMNPADRRIVHITLADDPGVATESEGDGYFKRITVRPT